MTLSFLEAMEIAEMNDFSYEFLHHNFYMLFLIVSIYQL